MTERLSNPDAYPGPIAVSSDGRGFVDVQGRPFFWLGDTAWPLFAQYTLDEAKAYLDNRSRKGFTVVQGVLAWGGGTGFEEAAPGPNWAGHRPWLESPAAPNPVYFENVDDLLRIAASRGLILAMLPTWGYYVNDVQTFNTENAFAYGRWLGSRYKEAPNVIWASGGDRVPTGFEPVWRALAMGLRAGDGGAHLITYHPCGWQSSSYFFHCENWLDFNMIETWTDWPMIYPAVAADAALAPRKPVVLGEPAYEDGPEYPLGPITPLIVRRQAWWAFMAGGFFTYGQDQMWRMDPGWTSAFDTPGAGQMTIFKSIVTAHKWWELFPNQGLLAGGVSSERTLNAACRSADGTRGMIYLSSQCHALVKLDRIATRNVKVTWVNPADGEERDAGTFATGNRTGRGFPESTAHWFSVPGHWEDAVLILEGTE